MNILIFGLSLSSSWGNGHATTFRALIRGLAALGHDVDFLERDVPWYADHRDVADPDFCTLSYYRDLGDLDRFKHAVARADVVIVGSYVPDGVAVIDRVLGWRQGGVVFYDIDTPVTLAQLRRGGAAYLALRQVPLFDLYLSFAGGPTLVTLEQQFGAVRAAVLYCSVDETRYRNTGEPVRWDLGYLGTYSDDRQPTLERLLIEPARRLPGSRFVVAGPQYPGGIDWPANVERIDHLPPSEHASFYSRQRFTLNVTRADMAEVGWSPSVRLFEAAACGVPIITDRWAGLEDVLPHGTTIIADDADDVARAMSLSATRRGALADAARQRVLEAHTGTARARELVGLLRWSAGGTGAKRNQMLEGAGL